MTIAPTSLVSKEQGRAMSQESFEDFWKVFPRRIAKFHARTAWDKARKHASAAEIIEGAKKYAAWLEQAGPKNWRPQPKHPATWLNGGCWLDEYGPQQFPRMSEGTAVFLARWEHNNRQNRL